MKKLTILGLALALIFSMAAVAGANTFTIYDGSVDASAEFNWEAAVSQNFQIQEFDVAFPGGLNPGVTVVSGNGVVDVPDSQWHDIVVPGGATTTWSFTPQIFGLGATNVNLAGPGGPGTGIDVYADGEFVGLISNTQAGQWWGFLGTDPVTSVLFQAGSQGGVQETYVLEHLHYASVPVPPTVWLFGTGLLGLLLLRRKVKD